MAAALLFVASISCGREVTGPAGRGPLARVAFTPDFSAMLDTVSGRVDNIASLVPFSRVRVELRRVDNSVAASEVVDFPETATEIPLSLTVRLGSAATSAGEPLSAFLRYINNAGDTVFAGGPVNVVAAPAGSGAPPQNVTIPIQPTAPGAVFARVDIAPDSLEANTGTTQTFTATGYDTQNQVVANAIIGFVSRNPALATVPNLATGTVNLVGVRGETWIVAQSLTGLRDSARLRIRPIPVALAKIGGDAQSTLQEAAFPQPLRVRVRASDSLPVAGVTVTFAVATGGGSLSATTAITDTAGVAQVTWTAGSVLGPATVTARVGTALATTFTGTQLNAGPTSLAFETEPTNIVAGAPLPDIKVLVRNALGQTITTFTGAVSLTRVGTGGGRLVGDTIATAVAGRATFSGLTVDRPGTDYKLVAVLAGVPNQLSATFAVTAAPPASLQLVSGGGQTGDAGTALPAPIVVRVRDVFNYPVRNASVTFAVTAGGGTVAPVTATTDSLGTASTTWTLGSTGSQTLRVSVGSVTPLDVTAFLNLGGPPVLFAGYDSTAIRIGQTRNIPLYLSNRADTAITVTLTADAGGLQWSAGTVQFAPFTREVQAPLTAPASIAPGTYWVRTTSAVGTDSVMVTVDSAFVMLASDYGYAAGAGDTVHIPVRLSDPAPAGGQTVRVKTLNAPLVQVMAATGGGPLAPGCLNVEYCYTGALQTTLGTAGDSVDITIPAGEMLGHVAFIVVASRDTTFTAEFTATSPTHRSARVGYEVASYRSTLQAEGGAAGVGVGQRSAVYVTSRVRELTRDRNYRLRSLTPALLAIDTVVVIPRLGFYSSSVDMRGLATGTGQVEFGNADEGYDTLTVPVVTPRVFSYYTGGPTPGRILTVTVAVGPASGVPLTPDADLPITLSVRDTSIVRLTETSITLSPAAPYGNFSFLALREGMTSIVLSAPGYATDSVFIRTGIAWGLSLSPTSQTTTGVGTSMPWTLEFPVGTGPVGSPRSVDVVPRRPSIGRALTPRVELTNFTDGRGFVDIAGVSVGVDTIDLFLDGVPQLSIPYAVTPARVLVNTPITSLEPDTSLVWDVGAVLTNDQFQGRQAVDSVRAVLRSSDPRVVRVTDSTATFPPGTAVLTGGFGIVAAGPGNATLTISAPGFLPDTHSVTVRPYELYASLWSPYLAVDAAAGISLWRNSATTTALPISVTHRGSGRVDFVQPSVELKAGLEVDFFWLRGVRAGTDTVVLSAPGHAPYTIVFDVDSTARTRLYANGYVYSRSVDADIYPTFYANQSSVTPAVPRRLRIVSRDTTKARVERDTIFVGALGDSVRPAVVRYLQPGAVTLVMTDLDGRSPADSLRVYITPPQLYGWTGGSGGSYLSIGMGQRTYSGETYVELPFEADRDVWVKFSASRPGLLTLPDSVRIPAGQSWAPFDLAARDTVGAVRVSANVPGVAPWEFDVMVTRTMIGAYSHGDTFVGSALPLSFVFTDGLERIARPLAAPVSLRLRSDRPDIARVTDSTVTILATEEFVERKPLFGQSAGRTVVRIRDARGDTFQAFEPGFAELYVFAPTLRPAASQYLAAPGLISTGGTHRVDASLVRDSVWVRLSSKRGRFLPATDSVLVRFDPSQSASASAALMSDSTFALRGISAGEDTLVFKATGLPDATALVRIEPGILQLAEGTRTVITVGDSTLITLTFAGPDGEPGARTGAPVPISYGLQGAALMVEPATVFTNATTSEIPAGATSVSFWVKAATPGLGTFEVTSPSFRTFRVTLEAKSRP